MKTVDACTARSLLEQGALLVDIRAPDEHARERISGACCVPLDRLQAALQLRDAAASTVVFHCRSGMRTRANAAALEAAAGGREVLLLDGGIDAWKQAGLPVVREAGAPLELNRQVQIAVGVLLLAGSTLAATVSPWFLLLTGFLGAGLLFAGVSGFCGLAHVLLRMPWNRAMRT